MSKKHHEAFNPGTVRDESDIFLDRLLQWLCDLQSKDVELFEEEQIVELGQTLAKKLNLVVFCDLDRNYRSAHNLRILLDKNGKASSVPKEHGYYAVLKATQFEVRIDISRKGGFFACVPMQYRQQALFGLASLPRKDLSLCSSPAIEFFAL